MPTDQSVQHLITTVRTNLKDAMRRRDRLEITTLREILSAVDNASAIDTSQMADEPGVGLGASEAVGHDPTFAEIVTLLEQHAEERRRAAATYEGLGHADRAEEHARAATVIAGYLTPRP